MTWNEIKTNLQPMADFSAKAAEFVANSDMLFDYLDQLPTSIKQTMLQRYANSTGRINKLRNEVAIQITSGKVNRQSIYQEFTNGKNTNPKDYGPFKNLFNLLYTFLIEQDKALVDNTLSALSEILQKDLSANGFTEITANGFDGGRHIGDEHAWFAIYNNTHPNQQTAKQLFFSVTDGKIKYGLYDRPNNNMLDSIIVTADEIDYNNVLNFYKKYLQEIKDNNFRAGLLKKYPIQKIIEDLKSEIISAWLIKPGEKGWMWKQALKEENIRIGWGKVVRDIIEANDYSDDFVLGKLNSYYPTNTTQHNNKNTITYFTKDVNTGDVVFAVSGTYQVIGVGVVSSELVVDEEYEEYAATHHVDWLIDLFKKPFEPPFKLPIKTVTELDSKNGVEFLQTIFGGKEAITLETNNIMALNQILYGPPGTGKTYNTIKAAVEIIEGKTFSDSNEDYAYCKKRFDELLGDQIEFITFHQNYSYEDFISGIKPDVKNSQMNFVAHTGVFKEICKRALQNFSDGKAEPKGSNTHDFNMYEAILSEIKNRIESATDKRLIVSTPSGNKFSVFKVDNTAIRFNYRTTGYSHEASLNLGKIKEHWVNDNLDALGGLIPYYNGINKLFHSIADEIERKIEAASQEQELLIEELNTPKKFVLIIDEINRANISRVFGELITLIEDDKRWGNAHQMSITQASGESFAVPNNLYLIGTMNTADKSIALLDIALRRRFEFKSMYPKYDIIGAWGEKLKALNLAIKGKNKSSDFFIGHAFFMNSDGTPKSETEMRAIFNRKIIPLLLEYFQNKTEDVKQVLGVIVGLNLQEQNIENNFQLIAE